MFIQSRPPKPLSRLQAYLVELKAIIALLRDVLVEVKELLVVLAIILFFLVGVWETLGPKLSSRQQDATSHAATKQP